MESVYRIGFAVLCPILALGAHEMTHIAVARQQGPVSINIISAYPKFRLELDYHNSQSNLNIQFMAASPFIIGVVLAIGIVHSGFWQQIQMSVPYYIQGVLILSWAAYSHLSPADVRTILNPRRNSPS